jgi:outer membrane lipoprotein-sorting protein
MSEPSLSFIARRAGLNAHNSISTIIALLILGFILLCLPLAKALSQSGKHDQHLIAEAQNYLNSLQNITGRFVQTDTRGNIQTGQFFLSKPAKLRWEYHSPKPIWILMNGDKIFYRDQRLNQTSEYHSPDFLLQMLTSKQINLFTESTRASTNGASIDLYVTVPNNNSGQLPETFIMRFSKNPVELLGLTLSDGTKIRITDIIKYQSLDKKIFTLH